MIATPKPLMQPTMIPIRIPTAKASAQLAPLQIMEPTTTAVMPRQEPTDTSISPTMMVNAIPTEMMTNTTEELKQAAILLTARNAGLMQPTTAKSKIRKKKLVISLFFKSVRKLFIILSPFQQHRRKPS